MDSMSYTNTQIRKNKSFWSIIREVEIMDIISKSLIILNCCLAFLVKSRQILKFENLIEFFKL